MLRVVKCDTIGVKLGDVDDDLRQTVRAQNQIAECVGRQQRHVADVVIVENNAEFARIGLDVSPGGQRVVAVGIQVVEQLAGGRHGTTNFASSDVDAARVLTQ